MTREEYLERLSTELATPNQVGRIVAEFDRLGFHWRTDRPERLRVSAALLGLSELGSTRALTQGQAGQLVGLLGRISDCSELYEAARFGQDREPAGEPARPGIADGVLSLVRAVLVAQRDMDRMRGALRG